MARSMRLSFGQKYEINKYLEEVLVRGDDGRCTYKNDENDASVAKRFGCHTTHVAGIRLERFGRVREARKASIEDRLRSVEQFLDELNPNWRQRLLGLEDA